MIFPDCTGYQNNSVHIKQNVIVGAAKCSTKPLSTISTSIFTVVKTCLQTYHDTCFSRIGFNLMWILQNSKILLDTLNYRSQYVCDSITTFDFSILYTTIPHTLLKSGIKELVHHCISKKNEKQRYQHLVIGKDTSVFVKSHSRSNNINRTRSFQCQIFLYRLHICPVWRTVVSASGWYPNWYEQCSACQQPG